jgi:hypothetical protein
VGSGHRRRLRCCCLLLTVVGRDGRDAANPRAKAPPQEGQPLVRPARTTAVLWPKGWLWAKRSAAPGTTRDSACARAKPKQLPLLILSHVSLFNGQAAKSELIASRMVTFQVACPKNPESVVIIGAGAAGTCCADMLRRKGYNGPIALVGDEEPGPIDLNQTGQRRSFLRPQTSGSCNRFLESYQTSIICAAGN